MVCYCHIINCPDASVSLKRNCLDHRHSLYHMYFYFICLIRFIKKHQRTLIQVSTMYDWCRLWTDVQQNTCSDSKQIRYRLILVHEWSRFLGRWSGRRWESTSLNQSCPDGPIGIYQTLYNCGQALLYMFALSRPAVSKITKWMKLCCSHLFNILKQHSRYLLWTWNFLVFYPCKYLEKLWFHV